MNKLIIEDELNIENKTSTDFLFDKDFQNIIKSFKKFFKLEKSVIVDLTLTNDETIRKLNKKYRKKDKATDILSFDFSDSEIYESLPFKHMGELVMSVETVERQSKEFNHSLRREYCYLFTHGLVHLMGYDHEEENERIQMNSIVDQIISPLNITREN